jgi:hypothetical protein
VKKIEAYETKPIIATRQREVNLLYRKPNEREIKLAEGLLQRTRKERDAINSRATSVATRVIEYANPEYPRTEPVLIQAFRIGDQAIVSMPLKCWSRIGLEIKKNSPVPPDLSSSNWPMEAMATSHPPTSIKLGGYETWLGTSRFLPQSSDILIKNLLEMLEELKGINFENI